MSEETTKLEPKNEVITLNKGSITFTHTKEQLEEECLKYSDLTINGLEDSGGLKAVKDAKRTLVKARTCVTSEHALQKRVALDYGRECDRRKKELLEVIEPTETKLKRELDKIKEEEESLAAEAQRKKEAKIKARKQTLLDAGASMGLDGFTWGTPPQAIPEFTVLMSDDDKFETIVQTVACWKDEQDEIAAKAAAVLKKAQDEEAERLADQKKKEQELAAREAKIKVDEEKAEKEKQQRIKEEQQRRINACIHLGLIFDGEYYVYGDVSFHSGEMNAMNVFEFNDLIEKAQKRMAEIRKEEDKEREAEKERIQKEATEKAEKEVEQQRRKTLLESLDMVYHHSKGYVYYDKLGEILINDNDILSLNADDFNKLFKSTSKRIVDIKELSRLEAEKQKEAKAKEEAEHKERLKPDKQKLLDFANVLYNMEYPKVSSNEAKDIVEAVRVDIDNAAAYINNKANEL